MDIPNWQKYQRTTANFFAKIGLNATIEQNVYGARGKYEIDVLVQGNLHGIPFQWLIECKAWKSNIPQEKVLAFASIIQDIGADRGFLLSEKGFQSGAILVAENTNITLTSLANLNSTISYDFLFGKINWRLKKAQLRLIEFKKKFYKEYYIPPMSDELGELFLLESVLNEALNHNYPIIYQKDLKINSYEELVLIAEEVLVKAENWCPNN